MTKDLQVAHLAFRPATPDDLPEIVAFIGELAAHEGRPEIATIDTDTLSGLLFGSRALGRAYLGLMGEEVAAYAIVAERFASFRGTRYLYIEDMLVRQRFRGGGAGRLLLAFLAREAQAMGCERLEWSALENNDIALGFYDHLDAEREDGVVHFSLGGASLRKLLETRYE